MRPSAVRRPCYATTRRSTTSARPRSARPTCSSSAWARWAPARRRRGAPLAILPEAAGRRFKVTVVDDKAVRARRDPGRALSRACRMSATWPRTACELASAEFERADFLFDPGGSCDVTSVYVCVGDDAVGLGAALHLRHRLGGRRVPIVVRTTQEGGVAAFLGERARPRTLGRSEVFGLLDLVCRPDVLLRGQNEVLAQAIHHDYRPTPRRGRDERDRSSAVRWEQLPETLRESNRRQAADIGRKLRAIGCDIEPLADWDAPPLAFSAAEVEQLARMEHDRWRAEREPARQHGRPTGSEPRRDSPYFVPWGGLPEEIKEVNRDMVRAMPAVLAGIGFAVVRLRPAAVPA